MLAPPILFSWSSPLLPAFAERFLQELARDSGDSSIVVPTNRSARRLAELLAGLSATHSILLPRIMTLGVLKGYQNSKQFVLPDVAISSLWVETLLSFENLQPLIPTPPARDDYRRWVAIADSIQSIREELEEFNLTFKHILKRVSHLDSESSRWQLLVDLEDRYQELLAQHELAAPSGNGDHGSNLATITGRLFLLGITELSPQLKNFLEKLPAEVVPCVHGENLDGFDEYGLPRHEYWYKRGLKLAPPLFVQNHESQARAVRIWASELDADEVGNLLSITAADKTVVPYLVEELSAGQRVVRDAAGARLKHSPAVLFLQGLANFLRSHSMRDFLDLIRHPDLQYYLAELLSVSTAEMITAFDRDHQQHLQAFIGRHFFGAELPAQAYSEFAKITAAFTGPPQSSKAWSKEVLTLLEKLHRQDDSAYSIYFAEGVQALVNIHDELNLLPDGLLRDLSASDFIDITVGQISYLSTDPQPRRDCIDIIGWIDCHLDDAPYLALCGLNEGSLPESLITDLFLPDTLRESLGLPSLKSRLVRDRYLLEATLRSRVETVLIAGKESALGEMLQPSPLLLLGSDEQTINSLQRFFDSPRVPDPREGRIDSAHLTNRLQPEPTPIQQMSVAAFDTYNSCPFLFYLNHVLRLETLNDRALEMDARQFGILAHSVLEDFAKSGVRDSADALEISSLLSEKLDKHSNRIFGKNALASTKLQVEQLRARLSRFADWQSGWRRDGWEIRFSEYSFDDLKLPLNGAHSAESMTVRGRVDRIDYNPALNRWAIIDYKVWEGEARSGKNKDLQLQLYRWALMPKFPEQSLMAMYLPITAEEGEMKPIEAVDANYDFALEKAKDIATAVRSGVFWPPADRTVQMILEGVL